jgi:hypothetical protein
MHKNIYASGFLYHSRTQQILLQQENIDNSQWSLFSGDNEDIEDIKEAFLKIINKHLKLELKPSSICPVYNYLDNGKNIHIFYANVKKVEKFFDKKKTFSWFTFKQIQKLLLSEQVKQDIIVSQRVIDSSIRRKMGLRTIG